MSDSKGWFARQLGGEQQHAPAQPPVQPQQFVPQAPQQAPVQPQHVPQQQQAAPPLDVHNFGQAMNYWQGGEATRTETQLCPSCGSNHYYSRSQTAARGPAPSPMCFDCGYNSVYHQETVS